MCLLMITFNVPKITWNNYYTKLFYTPTLSIEDELLSLFDPIVSAEDNFFLCALPLEEEVVQALDL